MSKANWLQIKQPSNQLIYNPSSLSQSLKSVDSSFKISHVSEPGLLFLHTNQLKFCSCCIDYFRWISWNHGYDNISASKDTLCEEGNEDSDGWSWCCRKNNYPLQAETRRDCHYHTHNRYVLSICFTGFIILNRFDQTLSCFPLTSNFQLLFMLSRAFESPHFIFPLYKFDDPNHIFGIHGAGFNVETVEYKNVS